MKQSFVKWMKLSLVLSLLTTFNFAWADDGFYVVAVGKRAKRTILVSPQNSPTASGTALLNAINGITDASASNPYLVLIEPGIFDIGANSLQMKEYVDIQGSGQNVTKITGNREGWSAGVLRGADNAELRFLTVENTGGGTYSVAIFNSSCSPAMTRVTAKASGGTDNHGIRNYSSSPIMTNVTAEASGDRYNYGVFNSDDSSPIMTDVTAKASGGSNSGGVYNLHSSPTMINGSAEGSGALYYAYGIRNWTGSPIMRNVNITASEGALYNYGVYNSDGSSPTMTNVIVTVPSGTYNCCIRSTTALTPRINHSLISGSCAIQTDGGCTAYVGNTMIDGAVGANNICAGVYDENYVFFPDSCP